MASPAQLDLLCEDDILSPARPSIEEANSAFFEEENKYEEAFELICDHLAFLSQTGAPREVPMQSALKKHRAELLNWACEILRDRNMGANTLFLMAAYLDETIIKMREGRLPAVPGATVTNFFQGECLDSMELDLLKVFALAALSLAMKKEEIHALHVDQLQVIYPPPAPFDSRPIPKASVFKAERLVLVALDYRMWITTPYTLLKALSALERRSVDGGLLGPHSDDVERRATECAWGLLHTGSYRSYAPVASAVACYWRALESVDLDLETTARFEGLLSSALDAAHLTAAVSCFHSSFDQDEHVLRALQPTPTATEGRAHAKPASSGDLLAAAESPSTRPSGFLQALGEVEEAPGDDPEGGGLGADAEAQAGLCGASQGIRRIRTASTLSMGVAGGMAACKRRRTSTGSQVWSRSSNDSDKTSASLYLSPGPSRMNTRKRSLFLVQIEEVQQSPGDEGAASGPATLGSLSAAGF